MVKWLFDHMPQPLSKRLCISSFPFVVKYLLAGACNTYTGVIKKVAVLFNLSERCGKKFEAFFYSVSIIFPQIKY